MTAPGAGNFTITATYSGDSGHNPSTSPGVALNVKANCGGIIVDLRRDPRRW